MKQQDEIKSAIDPTKQTGKSQVAVPIDTFRENNAADIQTVENARLQAVSEANEKPQKKSVLGSVAKGVIDLPNRLKKLLNTKNEVNDADSRNTNNNMQ